MITFDVGIGLEVALVISRLFSLWFLELSWISFGSLPFIAFFGEEKLSLNFLFLINLFFFYGSTKKGLGIIDSYQLFIPISISPKFSFIRVFWIWLLVFICILVLSMRDLKSDRSTHLLAFRTKFWVAATLLFDLRWVIVKL